MQSIAVTANPCNARVHGPCVRLCGARVGFNRRVAPSLKALAAGTQPTTVGQIMQASTSNVLLDVSRKVLNDAEEQIRNFCNDKSNGAGAERCQRVLEALQSNRVQAEMSCELANGRDNGSCEELASLEKLVHELSYCDVQALCAVLAVKFGVDGHPDAGIALERQEADYLDEIMARSVFEEADMMHHGELDKEQLLWALRQMGYPMTHAEVNKALTALDAHGYVTYDTFMAMLKIQAQRHDDGCDEDESSALWFSAIPHPRPSWWSDSPHEVDYMW